MVDERNMFSVGGYNPANVSSQTDPPNVVVLKEVILLFFPPFRNLGCLFYSILRILVLRLSC